MALNSLTLKAFRKNEHSLVCVCVCTHSFVRGHIMLFYIHVIYIHVEVQYLYLVNFLLICSVNPDV